MSGVEHPRIRPGALDDRLYQAHIAATAVDHNTLAVLPTGLGKTAIALRVIAEYLLRAPTRSVLFLAPTRPLVLQHAESVRTTLFAPPVLVLTGTVEPARRARELKPPQVVVATPQVIGNDLASGAMDLDSFSLLVFDEAHRAIGEYPYAAIGQANQAGPRARVLAMTASPGSSLPKIRAIWANLGIERFEYRVPSDPDVRPYVHDIGVEVREVAVPVEVQHLAARFRTAVARQVAWLGERHLLPAGSAGSRRDLLALGEHLRRELDAHRRSGGNAPAGTWAAVTAQSVAMKGLHALELVESQGTEQLRAFLDAQESPVRGRRTPAQRQFLLDPDVAAVREILRSAPTDLRKTEVAVELVRTELARNPAARVILFTQYRATAERVVRALEDLHDAGIRPARFVGQAARSDDPGLSQREQGEILDRFRAGTVNCLVATSVAEEGLDIPSTDLVVFYEPVPDVIRTIQR
ncbi:MAG TPA: DEAD/DEAH box helicase, partial [Thermoplasmata archaeon]|nr:DEAD/DEAH box helicase [Thermoplasmata archaeon]